MCNEEAVFDAWQVHSDVVVCTDRPRLKNEPHSKADAILTDQPGITLFMRFADCVPILLWDPGHKVIGLVHAGWQGTVKFTASRAIEAMQDQYGSRPAEIIAAIGPSIAAHHYPVGEDVTREIRQKFGQDAGELLSIGSSRQGPQETLDLWKANQLILERAGVDKVELANLCTACHLDDWYSHRAESGKTGRFGVLIRLP
jgi:YfiH family protein